jgi:hypothetical protein
MDAARAAQQLTAMDATALVAELRALTAAGSSYDEQARCCGQLRASVASASPLPTGAAAEDAVGAVAAALSGGVRHAALQLVGCDALTVLLRAAPAISATAGAAVATAVLAALSSSR